MNLMTFQTILVGLVLGIPCCGVADDVKGCQSASGAYWTVLPLADDQISEIAVDFRIEEMEIGSTGDIKAILKAGTDKDEMGFIAQISSPSRDSVWVRDGEAVPISKSILTVTSLGRATELLEKLIHQQLLERSGRASNRFLGRYLVTFDSPVSNFEYPRVFNARSDGVTFDQNGKPVPEAVDYFYDLMFVIDAPRKRLTVYFSERAGYGGASNAAVARQQWLKSITLPKGQNKGSSQSKGSATVFQASLN